MSDWSDGASGAASGAAAGSSFGPWGTVIGAGIGLVGGMLSNSQNASAAEAANRQNWEMFEANAQFQREMAKRAYTYRVEDLKLAGLNPMLAIGGPGSSLGGGGTSPAVVPQFKNLGDSVSSGAALGRADMLSKAQVDLLQSQTATQLSQSDLNSAQAAKARAETQNTIDDNPRVRAHALMSPQQIEASINNLQSQDVLNRTEAERLRAYMDAGNPQAAVDLLRAQAKQATSSAGLAGINALLGSLEVAAARNKEASDKSWWGSNIRPYLPDVGAVTSGAGSLVRMYKDVRGVRDLDWKQGGMTNTRTGEMTTRQRAR